MPLCNALPAALCTSACTALEPRRANSYNPPPVKTLAFLRDLRSYYHGSRGRDQREFYDLESSLPYFDHVNRILCKDKRRVLLEFLAPAAHPREPILDVGCGIGTFARIMAQRGEHVVGVDISRRKIARARAHGLRPGSRPARGRIDYFVGDLQDLGRGGALDLALSRTLGGGAVRFGRIVASDVIEHLPAQPRETAGWLRSLLPAGGQLLASVPSRLCVGDPGHIWRLLPPEWEDVFRTAGFRVQEKRMSRIAWYGLVTPLPLAMVFDLRRT